MTFKKNEKSSISTNLLSEVLKPHQNENALTKKGKASKTLYNCIILIVSVCTARPPVHYHSVMTAVTWGCCRILFQLFMSGMLSLPKASKQMSIIKASTNRVLLIISTSMRI